jgi:hypothetical protein
MESPFGTLKIMVKLGNTILIAISGGLMVLNGGKNRLEGQVKSLQLQ